MGMEDWLIQMGIALFIGIMLILIVTCLIQGTIEYFSTPPKPKVLKFTVGSWWYEGILSDEEIKSTLRNGYDPIEMTWYNPYEEIKDE